MSEQKHTQEPWFQENTRLFGGDGFQVTDDMAISAAYFRGELGRDHWATTKDAYIERDEEEVEANAKRIVQCVNTCAGVTEAELASIQWHGGVKGMMARAVENAIEEEKVKQQRDELLAALKALAPDVAQPGWPSYDKAIALIAKVESK